MVGPEAEPIQTDESYFAGRRKYNPSALGSGARQSPGEDEAPAKTKIELSSWGSVSTSDEENDTGLTVQHGASLLQMNGVDMHVYLRTVSTVRLFTTKTIRKP